ncbi:hypothetical protein [Haloprofundus sp. MHR1]|uniref:hypothetical protein n=1 Tax=Haloprofundus sp. MHR1 TaxID=2572921 RepID=UPI0010BE7FDD|nr:hypothetical protein [Haloprofundus sp. MHR1]QCJ47050.1 hypothetical protein FCF25_07965 [Haloprofundus sp. MHR1]
MSTDSPLSQEATENEHRQENVTGPHPAYDDHGRLDYRYWRCERCGFESVDPRLRDGCFRCGAARAGGDEGGGDAD